ncbi:molybdopterin-dependent oxidoreductase [Eggerthella sp. YY7918]|uniref:molybdopterin-dependent oxidoreductase n=1 Tax=Eggerthella sp. (strain YY7918) TaxID=502558 RepID=UPI0002171800|nr:molybdopterin-dependent oxidoreductase [Eggerthella sp. YY7918]BAK44014.1 anaerobic dehydrogenase [Eggerthella sp. YY7918]
MAENVGMSRRGFIAGVSALALGLSATGCSTSTGSKAKEGSEAKEEKWIPTTCNGCFNRCGILAHVVDGVAMELKGNPASPVGGGHICARGAAGLMQLYDPNRLTKPLKRTNPEKGFDKDPGWEEITWDEAYSLLEENLQAALEKNPQGVAKNGMVANLAGTMISSFALGAVYGCGTSALAADLCGTGDHTCYNIFTGDGNACPDYPNNKYLVQFGSQAAIATRHGFNMSCSVYAESRANGAKLVNIDPHMSAAGAKADQWIPIRPGTDAAVALAIANTIVNELGVYDAEFLKTRTNIPSLVDPTTNRIVREAGTNKALYWDVSDNSAKPYDACADPALEGTYIVNDIECVVAFDLYKEHIASYTPEYQEPITTVPADIIRKLAKEVVEAACIGETTTIGEFTIPYRPVAFDCFSGTTRHKHALLTNYAIMSLNALVGSIYAVGGFIGFAGACHGWTDDDRHVSWYPGIWEEDGLIEAVGMITALPESYYRDLRERDYTPINETMTSLTPLNVDGHFSHIAQANPDHWKTTPATFLWYQGNNCMKFYGNYEEQEKVYSEFDYVVGWDIYLNDTSYYADLMLPEASYLERYDPLPSNFNNHTTPGGVNVPWAVTINQPVVPARDDAPCVLQVWSDLADRAGATANLVGSLNVEFKVKEELSVPFDKKLDIYEYMDSIYKSVVDEEHDLAWFQENGVYTHDRDVDEVYIWAQGDPGRVPLYWDFAYEIKEKVDAKTAELGIPWETDDYQAFPEWKPCCDHEITDPDYDTYPIYYTDAVNTDTWQVENPWINELNERNPFGYAIEMNAGSAREKGLETGSAVRLVNKDGVSVEGVIVTSECIHPECVSVIGGHWGSKSEFLPCAKDKGVPIATLVSGWDPERMDYTCAAFDQCIRVKVEKM